MKLLRNVRYALSLLATAGLLSLLMADSAEDRCKETTFDRTFDVTTTCGGGEHSGRIRFKGSIFATVSATSESMPVIALSGDVEPTEAAVVGVCGAEDAQFAIHGITVKLSSSKAGPTGGGAGGSGGAAGAGAGGAAGAGGNAGASAFTASCTFDLKTQLDQDVTCTLDDGTNAGATCTARFSAAAL